ncbi:hypothetical protein VCRA2113O415_300051 [Vibrio crassostreae]|nr:hypothetical protein VCRA2113O415_300051 [Vibrio crassostreae]CAK2783323.1 hypothetical protein VCRA2113O420_310004 [Vibrio crassostreae]CAK3392655.1 hypothetical protein VCRA2121O436_310004 [Vibrio crassostreae]
MTRNYYTQLAPINNKAIVVTNYHHFDVTNLPVYLQRNA